jgi:putative sugar O-methyltransferase
MRIQTDESLVREANNDWNRYRELGLDFRASEDHTENWNRRFNMHKDKLGTDGREIDPEVLRNFRGSMVCVGDNPRLQSRGLERLLGASRGECQVLDSCLAILRKQGFKDLLRKYPCHLAGGPYVYERKGYSYTHRWIKHIYSLGLFNRVLGARLEPGFTALDIGSSYGIFSSLLFQEYPGSRHILVDVPEQLVFARYFLGSCFPGARIAGPDELDRAGVITRSFLEDHDFILMAPSFYEKIERGTVDLVSSFACLGEIKRSFFDYYLQAPVFKGSRYFYTTNPVDSRGWYHDSEISVLDYPVLDPDKRLHFGVSPMFRYSYVLPKARFVIGYRIRRFHPFFEYIGEL